MWSRLNATSPWWPAILLRRRTNKHGGRSQMALLLWGGTTWGGAHQHSWVHLKQIRCFKDATINPAGLTQLLMDEVNVSRRAALAEAESGELVGMARRQQSWAAGSSSSSSNQSGAQKRRMEIAADELQRMPDLSRKKSTNAVLVRRGKGPWVRFISGSAAAEATGVDSRYISDCCHGKRVST